MKVLIRLRGREVLDSTHPDKRRADARARQLRDSVRGGDATIRVVSLAADDPPNYRRPRRGGR